MPIGLAPLSVGCPDDPEDLFEAAERGGFNGVGMSARWPDGAWAPWAEDLEGLARVADSAAARGLEVFDVGVVRIEPQADFDAIRRTIEVARQVRASHLLVQGWDSEAGRAAEVLEQIAAWSDAAGLGVALEFMPYSEVSDLRAAVTLIEMVSTPRVGVLLDFYHLIRTGGGAEDIRAALPHIVLVQVSDAPAAQPPPELLRREALTDRRYPGEGEFPLLELLAALPASIPLTIETPCLAYTALPLLEQAERLGEATRALLRRANRLS